MDYDKKIESLEIQNEELKNKIEFLEFRLELIAEESKVNNVLFSRKINQMQYRAIMDIMDEFRENIDNDNKVNHGSFEQQIYEVLPDNHGDYHLCEEIAKAFMEDGRWEEVFTELYGDMPKYKYYMERRKKGEV